MRAIPTLDNPMWGQTIRPVETVLAADDGGGGDSNEPLDLYYRLDTTSLYLRPDGDSLYKRPGSP